VSIWLPNSKSEEGRINLRSLQSEPTLSISAKTCQNLNQNFAGEFIQMESFLQHDTPTSVFNLYLFFKRGQINKNGYITFRASFSLSMKFLYDLSTRASTYMKKGM